MALLSCPASSTIHLSGRLSLEHFNSVRSSVLLHYRYYFVSIRLNRIEPPSSFVTLPDTLALPWHGMAQYRASGRNAY